MSDKESTNIETALENVVEDAIIIESDSTAQESLKKVKTGGLWLFSLINLFLIIGICAVAIWTWYQWQQEQTNETDSGAQVEAQLSSMGSAISKSDAELAKFNRDLSQQNQATSKNVDELLRQILQNAEENKALQSRVADLSGRRPADWLLAEADYLVRIAGRKLWLENDVGTAMLMLQSADSRLGDLSDPSLFPIRKLIAEDIQTLRQVNPVSNNSVALALSGMIPQVNNLPLNALKIPEIEENKAQNELSENIGDWRTNLSKTWNALVDDFIQVDTSDKPIMPYLSTKQRWLITEQLKLALSQAKSASLAEQEALYLNSLQQASTIVIEHFQLDDTNVKQFADTLQQLQTTDISKEYPRQLRSANALKDVIEQRMQSVFKNSTSEKNSSEDGIPSDNADEGAL
ncbi:MAG: uroporphyrin-3 C-methyltransferase [Glaciecola sp.]|jgi:uroporphyrin-3 C-methyltransferase